MLLDIQVGKGYKVDRGNPIWRESFKKYGLQGIPYIVFLSPDGKELGRMAPEADISAWIEKAESIVGN